MVPSVLLATPAPISHRTAEENLGLAYLAAVLRSHGFSVVILDAWLSGWSEEVLSQRILACNEILWIGFSAYRSNMEQAIKTIDLLRAAGLTAPVVAGGYGPTFHTETFLRAGFDFVVRGEGEWTALDLTRHFLTGNPPLELIPNLSFFQAGRVVDNPHRPLIQDLDTLPDPARDTMPMSIARKSAIHIDSSRGCYGKCVFCSVTSFFHLAPGRQWRERSIVRFVDELQRLTRRGISCFKVLDDSFLEPPRDLAWCRSLADEIQSRGLEVQLRGSLRADQVTGEIVGELKRAGFFSFACGIENFSDTALKRMGKRATRQENLQALASFKEHGIYVQAGHILFDQGTTLFELQENLEQMRQTMWTLSKGIFSIMFAADGTPLAHRLRRHGTLLEDPHGLGNNNYDLENAEVLPVYEGLKLWHKAHSVTYDKTMDPLAAPKAISPQCRRSFHALSLDLRQQDLEVMKQLLDMAIAERPMKEVLAYVHQTILDKQPFYRALEEKLEALYRETGLIYDAAVNPFI
ncbi:MAG: B12-binding domain-containing radical SAM protein [Nitrospirae bacterium]|nr:B12-binding domain-containing radical SAM protein [Magnetococcales bacterium]HAT51185.1 radical SAM protein [Alphaproteobacteria bacterium]